MERAFLFSPSFNHGMATAEIDMRWERTASPIKGKPAWKDDEGRTVTMITRIDDLRGLKAGTVLYIGWMSERDQRDQEAEVRYIAGHRDLVTKETR